MSTCSILKAACVGASCHTCRVLVRHSGGEQGETAEMLEIVKLRRERDEARAETSKLCRDLGDALAMRDEALTRCHTVARTLTDAIGSSGFVTLEDAAARMVEALAARTRVHHSEVGSHHATLTELDEVRTARDGSLEKIDILDEQRRADSELIDNPTAALRALIDSVEDSNPSNTIRDIEAARALIGEGRS